LNQSISGFSSSGLDSEFRGIFWVKRNAEKEEGAEEDGEFDRLGVFLAARRRKNCAKKKIGYLRGGYFLRPFFPFLRLNSLFRHRIHGFFNWGSRLQAGPILRD
jgi:hypothetical protein